LGDVGCVQLAPDTLTLANTWITNFEGLRY
jgi:hypothetical protein